MALVYVFLFVLMAFIGGVGIGWFLLGLGTIAAAAPRLANGCATPFDILPAVWVTSLCSVTAGLIAAALLQSRFRP